MDSTPWGTGAVLRPARHYLIPSPSLSTHYAVVGDGRPMSLPTNEDTPTWDMGAVLRPFWLLPPSPPLAGVLCTSLICTGSDRRTQNFLGGHEYYVLPVTHYCGLTATVKEGVG